MLCRMSRLLQQADAGGLFVHFEAVNNATGLPVIQDNISGRSIVSRSADTGRWRTTKYYRRERRHLNLPGVARRGGLRR